MEIAKYKNIYYPKSNNSAVVNCLLKDRIWESNLVKIFNTHVGKDDAVIDAGAYIGLHTFYLASLAKKVYSFEGQPLISECVKKSLVELKIKNVIHKNIALGDYIGDTYIHTNNDGDASLEGIRDHKFEDKYPVKVSTIDHLIKEKIKLIKIDVEGSEWEVINGAMNLIERDRPYIILETFKTKTNMTNLSAFALYIDYEIEYLKSDNYLLSPCL